MIEVIKKVGANKDSKIVEGSVKDLTSKNLVWLNAVNPSKKELQEIAKKTEIPYSELKEYLDPKERPKTFELDKFSLIVFAAPITTKFITTVPISIFISATKDIITLSHANIEAIKRIKNLAEDNKLKIFQDSSIFVYRLMDEIMSDYFLLFDELEDEVERLEINTFKHQSKDTPNKIFKIKKSLIYFHKSLTANREVITGIEKEYLSKISKNQLHRFRELYNDIIQLIDTVETYREILTETLDMYLTSVSNNLNIVMKRLTVYATLVLVPTLISGIYGMNFRFMPELEWQWGYPFSIGLMVVSIIIIFVYFKRKEWI